MVFRILWLLECFAHVAWEGNTSLVAAPSSGAFAFIESYDFSFEPLFGYCPWFGYGIEYV